MMFDCTKKNNEVNPVEKSSTTNTNTSNQPTTSSNSSICGDQFHNDLIAGQNSVMGEVMVYNSKDMLYIVYSTHENWFISETHAYVGALENMPQTPTGNPKLGNFPYNTSHSPGVNTFTYQIPMNQLTLCFEIVAHASVYKTDAQGNVIQTETAFGKGNQINSKGSWAMHFNYCLQECSCNYTTVNADLFGGQTIPVGTLSITNDENNLYVTYSTHDAWFITQTHLYVGALENMPVNKSNTPIPGQFPNKTTHSDGTTIFMYTIPWASLPDCYIIAAHASVVKIENGSVVQTETAWSDGTAFENTNRWGSYTNYCTQHCN